MTFIKSPIAFRLARFPKRSLRPDDLDERGRPLVHITTEISTVPSPTYGPSAYRTACGQTVPVAEVERFAGDWTVTCPTCKRKDRPRR